MFCLKVDNFIVYRVTSPSGKIYIGLTKQGLEKRKYDHYYEANHGKIHRKFHKALLKYKNQLIWEILKTNLSKGMAQKYEIYFIKKFNSYENGYNGTLGGELNIGRISTKKQRKAASDKTRETFKRNPELRKNLSIKHKELHTDLAFKKKHQLIMKQTHGTLEARLRNAKIQGGKPFNVYNFITKEFVKTYDIIQDANKELGLPNGKVSWCLSGKRNHCKTYIFKYLDDPTVNGIEYNIEWNNKIKRKPNVNK